MKLKREDFKKLMEAYESKVFYTKDDKDSSEKEETTTQKEPEITADDVFDSVKQDLIKLNQAKKQEPSSEHLELTPRFSNSDISKIQDELGKGIEPGSRDTFNHKGLYLTISECFDVGRPLLVYGDTGIGKSTAFQHFAKDKADEMGRIFVDYSDIEQNTLNKLILSILKNPDRAKEFFLFLDVRSVSLSPDDLVGIPDIQAQEPYLKTKQLLWIWLATFPGAAGILFLDEMNQAKESIMSGLYQVVLDRKIGSKPISKDIMVGAAVNEGFSGTTPIIQGLMSRFRTGTLILDPLEWLRYSKEKGMDIRIIAFLEEPDAGEGTVADKLGQTSPKGNPYLSGGGDLAREEDRSYPTPRTIWEFDRDFKNRLREWSVIENGGITLGDKKITNYIDIHTKYVKKYGENFFSDNKVREQYLDECVDRLKERIASNASGYCGKKWGYQFVKYLFEDLAFKIEDILKHAKAGTLVKQYESASGNFNKIVRKTTNYLKKANEMFDSNNKTTTPEIQEIFEGVVYIIASLSKSYPDTIAQFMSDLNLYFKDHQDFKYNFIQTFKNANIDPSVKEQALDGLETIQKYK